MERTGSQMIETLKAPIIQLGKNLGYEIIENYDLGAGPIHITWVFKPGSESLPDLRVGFMCLPQYSESFLNEAIGRALLNLIDKLILVVPTESMTRQVKEAIESMPNSSLLQLRKYTTVVTPSTLTPKSGMKTGKGREELETSMKEAEVEREGRERRKLETSEVTP